MRYFVVACLVFLLAACASHDERYYRLHPKALQEALKNCPQSSPTQITCAELVSIADEMNSFAYQLQREPQAFGKIILSEQVKLAKLEADLLKHKKQSKLRVQIAQSQQIIAEYLAIVRWLESPGK
jgi:hypothetical protein